MLDAVGHDVSARAAQREVQHHNLIGGNESGDTHDKDQIPAREHRRTSVLHRRLFGPSRRHLKMTLRLTCQSGGRRGKSQAPSEQ